MGRALSTPEKPHLKNLSPEAKEKEEKERLARQRILLRVVTELWLVGVLRSLEDVVRPDDAGKGKENLPSTTTKLSEGGARAKNSVNGARPNNHNDAEPFPLEVLKDLLGHDREHANLPLVVIFVKSFGWEILGARAESGEGRKAVAADGTVAVTSEGEDSSAAEDTSPAEPTYNDAPIVSGELQSRFRNVLGRYFEDVKVHLIRNQKALATQARRNAEAYVKSGEVFEDRQGNHEKAVKSQEKLIANAQVLSEVLGSEMPDLKESDEDATGGDGEIGLVKTGEYLRGQAEGAGIWEDEEERRFYENLVDLKDRVPAILLEDAKKKKPESDEQVGKQAEETKEDSEAVSASTIEEPKQTDGDDQSTAIANKTVGAQVDGLLKRLKDVTSKEMVDEIAIDFCFLNSKASRNRMLKAISTIPKGRTDLLPLWSRLAATLGKYMADIPQGLIAHLDAEFRSLQRRKEKGFLDQVRTSNIRYLAELTKFGVVPEHVIFHCLRVSLDEFSRMNIEIICHLLENCGRYLLRNPVTSPRMTSFLDTLQRKKGAQHLGQQERMLIENAMYYVNPPQRAAIQQKERSPISQFIRKLIYLDMNKRNNLKIIKQIRKLHWEDQEVFDVLERVFSKPGKVKYSNIHILAIIAAALYRYHQEWVITVIDDLLENITVGLEHNDFKANQRRIAEVKYLGELYTYRMVDSPVIFDTLYRLVTFGHDGGIPKVDKFCHLDMPDDFFRMRLVCTLLDTCGQFFRKGAAEKKLDFFIVFFQYYMFTKDPVPMDVEFMIQETISSLRPEVKLAVDLNEASQQFAAAVSQNYQAPEEDKPVEIDSGDELSSEDDDDEDANDQRRDAGQSSSDEAEAELSGDDNESDADSEEESIVVTRQQEERDPEIEAEFDREFAKMMAESLDSRKFERKPLFDVPLPMKKNAREMATTEECQPESDIAPPNTMAFSLLTKRGNRQQVCSEHPTIWYLLLTRYRRGRLNCLPIHTLPWQ